MPFAAMNKLARRWKPAIIGFLLIGPLIQFIYATNLFAEDETCSCTLDQMVMPTLTQRWSGDIYGGFFTGPRNAPYYWVEVTTNACCSWQMTPVTTCLVDSHAWSPDFGSDLSEGGHTEQCSYIATNGSAPLLPDGTANPYYREVTGSAEHSFIADTTPPSITLTTPENHSVILPANAVLSGSIADSSSGLTKVEANLSISGGCYFIKKLFAHALVYPYGGYPTTSTGKYCVQISPNDPLPPDCDEFFGTQPPASFGINYDLNEYVDFSQGQDCRFEFDANATDRIGNGTPGQNKYFIVDQEAPAIQVSNLPVVLPSGPVTLIAGTAVDSAEIKYVNFKLEQTDSRNVKTYWAGAAWTENADTTVDVKIPAVAEQVTGQALYGNSFSWQYAGLLPKDMISGSHYKLTVYSEDKFGHKGTMGREFDYNACTPVAEFPGKENIGDDIFEVGTAVFRQLAQGPEAFRNMTGHVGVYIVSDSAYAVKNGEQEKGIGEFIRRLKDNMEKNGSLLPILNTDAGHFIVQSMDKIGVVYTSLQAFKSATPEYWGAREGGNWTPEQRDQIAFFAAIQLGKPYADRSAGNDYAPVGPDWAGETLPQHFRCDGLVVYAYKQAHLDDAVAGQQAIGTYPVHLANRPNWRGGVSSSAPKFSSPLQVIPEDGKFKIFGDVVDPESGMDRVDYYLGNPLTDGNATLLGFDDKDSLDQVVYSTINTCNPGTNLYARAVDRAGNWRVVDFELNEKDKSHSPGLYTVPKPDNPPEVHGRPRIVYRFDYQGKYAWHFQDDTTPTEDLVAYYAVDLPVDSWTMDTVNTVMGGESIGSFAAGPGPHKMYLAVADEYGSFTFQPAEDFIVPDFTALFGGPAEPAGSVAALSFESKTVPGVNGSEALVMAWQPPAGYSNSPASAAYEIHTTAQYAGGVGIRINFSAQNMSIGDKRRLHLLHNNNGVWEDVTVGVDTVNDVIFGYATTLSPFAIYSSAESLPEMDGFAPPQQQPQPPGVAIGFSQSYSANAINYISPSALVSISLSGNSAGATAYYILDAAPETGTPAVYSQPFSLPEGIHSLYVRAINEAGYSESSAAIHVDGTPPVIAMQIGTGPVANGGTAYITAADSVTLSAVDLESNGVTSGIKIVAYLVDVTLNSCGSMGQVVSTAPAGSCQNYLYTAPFSLSVGTHTVYYTAVDNVGNMALPVKSAYVTVTPVNSSLDTVPPTVTASIHGQVVADSATVVMASTDTVTLLASDEGSGLLGIYYTVDTVPSSTTAATYTAPFTLAAGTHMVYYTAVDKAGNQAAVKTFVSYIPRTYTWSGSAGDGNWYSPGNWRENAVPGALDTAVIATRDTVLVNSPALRVHDVILGDADGLSAPILKISTGVLSSGTWTLNKNATLEQSTTEQLVVGTLLMEPGSVLSHTQNTTARRYAVNLKAVNDLTMLAGSSIAVDGLGYAGGNLFSDGYGPGRGHYGSSYGSGGGHGGSGANSRGNSVGGAVYDSLLSPADLGSGGGGGSGDLGGAGGGAVALEAGGLMTLDGVISVNGTACAGDYCGGGSGGSVNLNAQSLKGTGSLRANGGGGSTYGGGGAGGRIGINAAVSDSSGLNLAATSASGGAGYGGAGTIYINSNGGSQLIVSNNANPAAYQTIISSAIAGTRVLTISTLSMANAQLAFDSNVAPLITANASFSGTNSLAVSSLTLISNFAFAGATLQQQSTTTLTFIGNLTMQSGSKITSAANPGGSRLYAVNLNVTGNMDIRPGAVIDVSSLGYAGGG